MELKKFTETPHCLRHVHCNSCRNDEGWRTSIIESFGEFECPLNIPIGASKDQLPEPAQHNAPPTPCKFATNTHKPVHQQRPCAGTWIICDNDKCPADQVMQKNCGQDRCKFYAEGYQ